VLRGAAAVLVSSLLVTGCSSGGSSATSQSLVVITAGGAALVDGAADVPPTLDLRVVPGKGVSAQLDGRSLAISQSDGAAVAAVSSMPLGSAHQLLINDRGGSRSFAFHVAGPTGAMAAVHSDPVAGTVLDAVFERAPDHAAVEDRVPGGTHTWSDASHLRVAWPSAPGGELRIPAATRTDRGSHLAGDLVIGLGAVAPGALRRAAVPQPAPAPVAPLVVAFSTATARSRAAVAARAGQLSLVSPTGWQALADGSIAGSPDAGAVGAAAAHGLPVWPLLQNHNVDTTEVATLLGDGGARNRLTAAVRGAAAANGFGGVQLDFEQVPPDHRDQLSSLVEQLARALHAAGRRLAVDVVPHKPGHLNLFSAAYDLSRIGAAADLVVLMAYDQHAAAGDPGPVAGIDWDRAVLAGSLGGLTRSRTLLGLPLYSRAWDANGVPHADGYAPALAAALAVPGARVDYDFAAATPLVRSDAGAGGQAVTWFDDADSLARKAALVRDQRLAGVAMWRLGFEDPALWTVLPAGARRL
jgi:spore germination protein YaaH